MGIKLRAKPAKPKKRTDIKSSTHLYDGMSLKELLDEIPSTVNLEDVSFNHQWDLGDLYSPLFEWTEEESDENFQRRVATYKAKLDKYNKWHEENKEEIEEEIDRRAEAAVLRKQQRIAKEERDLIRAISRLEKMKVKIK